MIRESYFFLKIKRSSLGEKKKKAHRQVCKSSYFFDTFLGIFSFTWHSSPSVYSVLQMRKQRPGEGPWLAQGHTASKRQDWGLKPGLQVQGQGEATGGEESRARGRQAGQGEESPREGALEGLGRLGGLGGLAGLAVAIRAALGMRGECGHQGTTLALRFHHHTPLRLSCHLPPASHCRTGALAYHTACSPAFFSFYQ